MSDDATKDETPTKSSPPAPGEAVADRFPVVGIGASAGGLAAFEAFFSGMPPKDDPGMAFVLVQHLAPDHKSILSDLVRRYTRMQVFEVEDGMPVQINCAYIIPPNYDMAFLNGTLQLLEPTEARGKRLPIDFFFRSLAQDQHERAIGIVLSGTGSDGALGVRAIKGEGGMVMVQKTSSVEFDGMPRAALSTGLVDYELPAAEMAAQLIAYVAQAFGNLPRAGREVRAAGVIQKIYVLLRAQTGHDFSQYKPSTIYRRIDRRMAVHQVETIDDYLKFLQRTPAEVEALFRDLLIGVTSFFRDPEVFKVLEEQVIPRLFEGKPAGATIRLWSPGCSTGEEAYSLAILLQERMEALQHGWTVQVFATDIDREAIASARTGVFPASIANDVSPQRLARFFTFEQDTYRIHKGVRDLLIFSEQDVIQDPPFSRLDLISCRNLLIYLNAALQKQLLPSFYSALNPGGWLFLGSSEGIGEFGDLFEVLDRKAKIFRRKESAHAAHRAALARFVPRANALGAALVPPANRTSFPVKLPLRELTEQALLQQLGSAAVLVNGTGDILYLHGRTGMYLEPSPGEAGINNILKMAREGLRPNLAAALHKARTQGEKVRSPPMRVKTNGHFTMVNLTVHPVVATEAAQATPEAPLFVVVLEEAAPLDVELGPPGPTAPAAAEAHIAALQQELKVKDEYLQSTHEALESSNAELKSSNEEMQSVNEELQSTNEELETSKEELQSVNEELHTVNTELNTKVNDLGRANNDMNNLLSGTGIATVFVDQRLRILRFTPTAAQVINLIPTDVGRPVGHLVSNLVGYDRLVEDVQHVLDTLQPRDREVHGPLGRWFAMRIRPYRTTDNVIEGAVITFVDITEIRKVQRELEAREARHQALMDAVGDSIVVLDSSNRVTYLNRVATGLSAGEVLGSNWLEWLDPDDQPRARKAIASTLETRTSVTIELRAVGVGRKMTWFEVKFSPLPPTEDGQVALVARDITDRKQGEEAVRKANEVLRLAVVVRDAHDAVTVQDLEGRTLAWNPGAARMYGWTEAEALALNVRDRIPAALRDDALHQTRELSRAQVPSPYRTRRLTRAGAEVEVWMTATALINEAGKVYAVATTERPSGAEPQPEVSR